MNLYDNNLYLEDVSSIAKMQLPWHQFNNKSILISGSTGLLGSFLVDVLMQKNYEGVKCKVLIVGRSKKKAARRFSKWWGDPFLTFIEHDVNKPFDNNNLGTVDYVFHLASNTHPKQYAIDPIGTITTNIIGLQNMLDFAVEHHASRFIFASSNEIYGENRGDTELFDESYCGYIDSNTLRAGYPESKRCGEALCQAYMSAKALDVVIPRFTRSYGPTMLLTDTKAISQFIRKGISGEDIVLKSKGTQNYSYTYVADAICGLLMVVFYGKNGEAYNIAAETSNITLRELAITIANYIEREVVFDIPDSIESKGYSKATKALLNGKKLQDLGWSPLYTIDEGVKRTIDILKTIE